MRAGVGWKPGVVGEMTLTATDDNSCTPCQFTDTDTAVLRSYANLLAAAVDRMPVTTDAGRILPHEGGAMQPGKGRRGPW